MVFFTRLIARHEMFHRSTFSTHPQASNSFSHHARGILVHALAGAYLGAGRWPARLIRGKELLRYINHPKTISLSSQISGCSIHFGAAEFRCTKNFRTTRHSTYLTARRVKSLRHGRQSSSRTWYVWIVLSRLISIH